MSESLWDATVSDLLARTASSASTPGGGSIGVLSGSFGLGLVVMALEITGKRDLDAGARHNIETTLAKATAVLERLRTHADDDIAAFQLYMSAIALPKTAPDEKATRKDAMAVALARATAVPLAAAADIVAALELARVSADLANGHVVSDVGAGAALLRGAAEAVLLNVDINLSSYKDEARRTELRTKRERLASSAAALATATAQRVRERLAAD